MWDASTRIVSLPIYLRNKFLLPTIFSAIFLMSTSVTAFLFWKAAYLQCRMDLNPKFESILKNCRLAKAHILAPTIVEFFKDFFLFVREALFQVLVVSCHIAKQFLHFFGVDSAIFLRNYVSVPKFVDDRLHTNTTSCKTISSALALILFISATHLSASEAFNSSSMPRSLARLATMASTISLACTSIS